MGRANLCSERAKQTAAFRGKVPARLTILIPLSQSQRQNPQPALPLYIPLPDAWAPLLYCRYFFKPRLSIVLSPTNGRRPNDETARLGHLAEHLKFTVSSEFSSPTRNLSTAALALSPIHRALGLTKTGTTMYERGKSLSSFENKRVGKSEVLAQHAVADDQHQFDIETAHAWLARKGASHD